MSLFFKNCRIPVSVSVLCLCPCNIDYELEQKVSSNKLKEILDDTKFFRIPRLALFYSELVHGIPPIFKGYAANVPALHSVLIFVSIKTLPISKVPVEERFLFR